MAAWAAPHKARARSFDGYLQLFHWTELIQSSPLAVERAVYEVVGGAYRKNNITTTELRFNPMKRNRGGEQDLDHIIAAALRGMDKATLEYPVKPGLLFCLDRAFPYELNEILCEKAIAWRDRGVVGIDIAGPESATFRIADYRRLYRRARQFGLGLHQAEQPPGDVDDPAGRGIGIHAVGVEHDELPVQVRLRAGLRHRPGPAPGGSGPCAHRWELGTQ